MIVFENVHKSYPTRVGRRVILDSANLVLDTSKNIGILGLNGAGKSTLLRLISGSEFPERGRIHRSAIKGEMPTAGRHRRTCAALETASRQSLGRPNDDIGY